jgi:hypothetical protein
MPRKPKPKETPKGQTHLDDAKPAEDPKPKESPEQQAADAPCGPGLAPEPEPPAVEEGYFPCPESPPDWKPPAVPITKENAREVLADRLRASFEKMDPPTLEEALEESLEPVMRQIHELHHLVAAQGDDEPSPFEMSKKTDKLFPAMLAFHKECVGLVEKDSDNPYFNSTYASRAQIKRITHKAMMGAGLFVMNSRQVLGFHTIEMVDDRGAARTVNCCRMNQVQRITHAASGQYVQTSMLMDSKGTGPQAMGTVDSYGARYNSIALLDLAAEDDDGESGQGRTSKRTQTAGQRAASGGGRQGKKKPPASDAVKKAREALLTEIKDRIEEAGILGEVQPSKILKEITSFPREGKKDFEGYDDIEQITSKGMVEASGRRLQDEHPVLSDEALGRSA